MEYNPNEVKAHIYSESELNKYKLTKASGVVKSINKCKSKKAS